MSSIGSLSSSLASRFELGDVAFSPYPSETHGHGLQVDRTFQTPEGLVLIQCPAGFRMGSEDHTELMKCASTGSLDEIVAAIGKSFMAIRSDFTGRDDECNPDPSSLRKLTRDEITSMITLPGQATNEVYVTPLSGSDDFVLLSTMVEGRRGTMVCDHCREPMKLAPDGSGPAPKQSGDFVWGLWTASQLRGELPDTQIDGALMGWQGEAESAFRTLLQQRSSSVGTQSGSRSTGTTTAPPPSRDLSMDTSRLEDL